MDINKIISRLKFRYPLFTTAIEQLTFVEDYTMPTAATDGSMVYYNPLFFKSLNQKEQVFVMAHEVSHVVLNHLPRLKGRNMQVWNIATDAVINAFLVRDGLPKIEGLIHVDDALEYSSEELYDKLMKDPNFLAEVAGDIEKASDAHKRWGQGQDDSDENEDKSKGNGKGNQSKSMSKGDDPNSNNGDSSKDGDDDKKGASNAPSEKEIFDENAKKRKENEDKLKKNVGSGFSINVRNDDSPIRDIKQIGKKSNLIDWRRVLRENCKMDMDYSFKDCQIEDGILVSRLIEIPSIMTEILVDTSGSIYSDLLIAFLKECKNLLQTSKIKVACFDDKVYDFVDIRYDEDLEKMKFKGGGGTNFVAAANGFSRFADNKIIFTDGYGTIKNPPKDIIWVVFTKNHYLPKECKIIYVSEEMLLKSKK